ncbi:hypothetical protein ACFL38_01240 [Candidatus Omnitrophota bacterium]
MKKKKKKIFGLNYLDEQHDVVGGRNLAYAVETGDATFDGEEHDFITDEEKAKQQ